MGQGEWPNGAGGRHKMDGPRDRTGQGGRAPMPDPVFLVISEWENKGGKVLLS